MSKFFIPLNDQNEIPVFGIGTYRMRDERILSEIIFKGLELGYRLIDTAAVYKNEEMIGRILANAFSDSGLNIKREDVFITSKLAPKDQGYEKCITAVDTSLKKLSLDYIDLYLIHWPGTQKLKPNDDRNRINRQDSWRALQYLKSVGKIRSIGISNYDSRHLSELLDNVTTTVKPAVLQLELHPLFYDRDVITICEKNGIAVQAYSSFGEGRLVTRDVKVAEIEHICKVNKMPIAHVLLGWAVQHGWAIIPKTSNSLRLKENLGPFQPIEQKEMALLDSITLDDSRVQKFCWDPAAIC